MSAIDHEIVKVFQENVHPLSLKMVEMLNEHYSHQTERRGCGYTQATRVLSEYINLPRHISDFQDLKLFEDIEIKSIKKIIEQQKINGLELETWRHLDVHPQVKAFIAEQPQSEYKQNLFEWMKF